MRDINFELIGRNVKFDEIVRHVITLQDLIDGNYNRSTMPTFFDTNNSNCEFIAARQYTGLKDKNGVEIYEGDIVQIDRWDKMKGQVVYDPAEIDIGANGREYYQVICGFICVGSDEDDNEPLTDSMYNSECEVIGNIYENSELLKGKE